MLALHFFDAMALILLLLLLAPDVHSDQKSVDKAWSILRSSLEDKSADKRAKAIHALGLLSNNHEAEALADKALSDLSPTVRAGAATALGAMQATDSKGRLEQTLKDTDVKVAVAAANALYSMHDPAAYEVYYALLTGERKSSYSLVQTELNRFKDRKQVEELAFQTGLGFVPFGGMSYQAWQTISHDSASPIRAAAAERLAHDPDPKTTQALAKMCFDKSWQVRFAVVDAIAVRGDPALQDSVITLMWDGSDSVRFEAAAAVVKLEGAKTRAQGRNKESGRSR